MVTVLCASCCSVTSPSAAHSKQLQHCSLTQKTHHKETQLQTMAILPFLFFLLLEIPLVLFTHPLHLLHFFLSLSPTVLFCPPSFPFSTSSLPLTKCYSLCYMCVGSRKRISQHRVLWPRPQRTSGECFGSTTPPS